MALLRDDDVAKLREIFAQQLKGDVTLVHYTQKDSKIFVPGGVTCATCKDATQLIQELAGTSERITTEIHDFAAELQAAEEAGIKRIPATVVKSAVTDGRVRFYGIPSGYEFATLIEDIIDAGSGGGELTDDTKAALAGIGKDVHIQVFVTPT